MHLIYFQINVHCTYTLTSTTSTVRETGAVTCERVQIWSTATSPASSLCLPVRLNVEGEEREHKWNPPVSEGE